MFQREWGVTLLYADPMRLARAEACAQVYHVGGTDPHNANVYDVNTSPGLREFSSLVRCGDGCSAPGCPTRGPPCWPARTGAGPVEIDGIATRRELLPTSRITACI